ncbi:hypothetical protein PVL29_006635 [Vitis rotundifolia]|uniref:PGG domain-containing protein n=2 Tax=Vitis rotundifolia TaxID=103349 RepID=A0AA39A7K4_VITRO|nr:hypothetical protein PVL29_006635 [Vitis rotundifolia]
MSNQVAAEDGTGTEFKLMDVSFYRAAAESNINILKHILEQDGPVVQLTHKKNTVLHIAAQFGQLDCVNLILQFPSFSSLLLLPNLKGDTPLHLAAREGHWVVTQTLIQAAKALPSGSEIGADKMMLRMTNNENDTALHEAVRYNHPDVVKLLILEDPDFIYGANFSGGTPLYMAAERGFHDLVQIIIDNTPASPAHSGLMGRTVLHAAVICNNEDMMKKILEWKSDLTKEVDNDGWSPLHCAAYLGYTSIVRQLLEKCDQSVVYLRVKNEHNKTALHIAASCGHIDVVKLLVSQYPDCCEQVDDNGNNALHLIMIKRGIFHSSGLLNFPWMNFRGLMNEKNVEGKTPLHLLADYQMFNCRSFMEHKMVDKMVLDNENSTPMDIMLSAEDLYGEKGPILGRLETAKASIGPLGWQKVIKQDNGGRRRKKGEQVSLIKKAAKIHLIVATLIATVTFAAGFTVPSVYDDQKKGEDQGLTVLAPPPSDGSIDRRGWGPSSNLGFFFFVITDMVALLLSSSAVLAYFLMALNHNVELVRKLINMGYVFTYTALLVMLLAFLFGIISGFSL